MEYGTLTKVVYTGKPGEINGMKNWTTKIAAKASKEEKGVMQKDTYCAKEMPSLALPISVVEAKLRIDYNFGIESFDAHLTQRQQSKSLSER